MFSLKYGIRFLHLPGFRLTEALYSVLILDTNKHGNLTFIGYLFTFMAMLMATIEQCRY